MIRLSVLLSTIRSLTSSLVENYRAKQNLKKHLSGILNNAPDGEDGFLVIPAFECGLTIRKNDGTPVDVEFTSEYERSAFLRGMQMVAGDMDSDLALEAGLRVH